MVSNKRTVCAGLLLLAALFFLVLVTPDSEAATYTVDNIDDGADYSNITQAVDNASAGDTIRVAARTYYDAVDVDKRLTLVGGNYDVSMNGLYNYCNNYDVIGYYNFDNYGNSYFYDRLWCESNHGDIEGATRTTSSFWGTNALDFDGNNDYGVVDHHSIYNVSEVSISAWINLDDNDTDSRTIFSNYLQNGSSRHGYRTLVNDDAKFVFRFGFGSGSGACVSDTEITENNWTLVTATYDESSIKLYINDKLDKTCGYIDSISDSDGKQVFGASDSNSDGTYDYFFDGTIDEVVIWKKAISSTDVENIFWGGNSQKPKVDASEGGYAFRLTVDETSLKNFHLMSTGSDIGESSGDAGLVIQGTEGDPVSDVSITNIVAYYNYNGLRVSYAKDIEIYQFSTHGCNSGDDLEIGVTLYHVTSSNIFYGNTQCTDTVGYYLAEGSNNNIFISVQTYSSDGVGFKITSNRNYFNSSYVSSSDYVGLLFYGGDNNEVNYGNYLYNKHGIGFTRGAENNQLFETAFSDNDDYDIHHGYDSNSTRNGWNNILIDVDFDELYVDSNSRLLAKTLVETTITDNGTYYWNRVNTTLDSDRKAYSGTNSFWAGDAEENEYGDDWDAAFKMTSDVSLPSGDVSESRILEIKTWYRTEQKFDGGRVYISKNSGTTWSLLTPLGGYDELMNDGSPCDNDEKAFTGDKSSLGWHAKQFNLSDYRGEDVRIKFIFCSDDSNVWDGWYIDDVTIYKDADPSVVAYFDDFERLGHMWVDPRDWTHEGSPEYRGMRDVDVKIIDGTSSHLLHNSTNLIAHWKFDESSGNTYDSVTNYYGSLSGATYTSGKFGNAVQFDGVNDYVYVSSPGYGKLSETTISAWVKFGDFPSGTYGTIINPGASGRLWLQVDNSTGTPVASFGGYGNVSPYTFRAISTTTLVSDVWYHLVGTYSEDGDFFKIYVNGTLEDTETLDSNYRVYTSYNWFFGRNYYSSQGSCSGYCYLNGTIDNVQVWDTVYGNSQISGLYNYPLSGPVLYSTQHYGGSDDKTDSEGKLDDIYVITKVYAGSSSGGSVNPYIGLRYGDWTKPIKPTTISNNEFEANILDFRVYNRNKEKLYYSLGSATGAASSANVIEVWPGKYKENVVINTRVTIIGSGQTRTIIDGRYLDSPIRINTNGDHTKIKNLQVTRSFNSTLICTASYGGISLYFASDVSIDNVLFFESYNGLMANKVNNLKVTNSIFDRGSSSGYYGVNICDDEYSNQDSLLFENNIVKKYIYGIHLSSLNQGIDIYNNYIHNNTQTGIYLNSVSYMSYQNNPLEIVGNRLVDNNHGFYKGDNSNSWGRNVLFKDNLVKSSSNYGVYCHYYCYDWIVENNTFDGDSDQSYGIYMRVGYRAKFGNNTFSDHTNYDIYLNTCGTGSNSNKFFYNTYSSIGITSSCQVDVYNNLNVKTVEQDSDPFSNVELEIKDSSKTYYETPHWGGSDSLTDSSGFISGTIFMRSGYYASSSTLTDNNITVNYAYGIRARSTWTTFDEDTTKSFTIPDAFRYGVVKNTNTSVIYTSFSSAISAASTGNVLDVWAWTYNENVEITKGITLIGNSTATAIINGGTGDYSIEVKSNDVTIKNLTLNGASDSLLYAGNYDNLHVENVVMSSSSSNNGIYFDRTSQTTIIDVTVNSTDRKSVYIIDGETITFKDSYFMNASSSHGFEIVDSEDIILDNVFVYNAGYGGSSAYGLYVSGSDKVTIRNSTKVASSKSYEFYANDASNLKIQNSTFSGKNLALIEESNGFLIENSVFKDTSSGDNGIYVKNTDSAIFQDNIVKNSAADGGADYGGIYLTGSSSNLIKNNSIINSGKSGIHLKSSSEDNKIYGNTVTHSQYSGLYIQSSSGTLVRNNTFSDSGDHGIKLSSSDSTIVDNNTLDSNSDYGIYVSSSEDLTIKSNSVSDNNAGIYVSNSDDAILSLNTVEDHTTYGIYFADSKRVKVKKNIIKTNNNDALVLSSNCDSSFIDNNTIKNNGNTGTGRAIKLYEVDNTIIYNNSIQSNDYSGIVITDSNSNSIVHNTIKGNGKYGISITNDLTKSANNTIKDNTINDNSDTAVYINGIYTTLVNNTIKYNEKDGIQISDDGARTTIQQNNIIDNEENAIHVIGNNALITSNTIDGDTSERAILVINSRSPIITNNTIEGGEQGIKIQNTINAFVYNNTVKDNSGYGIYLLMGSHSGQVKYNTVKSNEDDGIYLHSSNFVEVLGNTIQDNNGYGILASSSKLVEFKSNTLTENDGGVKYVDCDYCNLTSMTIIENGGRGIWFTSGSDNNYIKHTNSSDSSLKDVYLQDSNHNIAFNFTFSTISVDSNSTLTLTSNLEIVFHDGSGDGFQGIDFALLTDGVKVYATPFYEGTDAVSDEDGEAGATFSLNYRIYNRSTTPDNIDNVIKYHYGVRSKEKSIDMSTSHTETITVPSHWVKGLVKNIESGNTWYKIQDAIDNSSSGDTLHIWAWTYYENVDVDESLTIIGNGTGNTTVNATSSGIGFDIGVDVDDVTIRNLEIVSCGNTGGYNGIQANGDDAIIEHVRVSKCHKGITVGGSGVWIGNSTVTNNYDYGINVFTGDSSTTAVIVYNNVVSWNLDYGIRSIEDDTIIKSNVIRNNSKGIYLNGADDVVISDNTIADNNQNIHVYSNCRRVLIKNNIVSDADSNGMFFDGVNSDYIVIEGNTVKDNGDQGISIKHSDYFYLGNNTISGSGDYDLFFNAATIGNSAKNTTFSTIYVHADAYFAIYNDLTLKFMQNDTVGFEGLDVKLVSDGTTKYATSYYSGSDSKTDVNGSIGSDFTLKFRIYDGSSIPDEATTTLYYHHGVRAKAYNINMTTSHTETVTVPAYWKKGLIENLDTGLQSSTIQDAIDSASSGDRLQLWEWAYVEYGIEVTERVTIFGNSSSVTVSGNWQDEIFSLETNSITLKNLTIEKSGNSTDDECIDIGVGSGITVDNVILKNCNVGILVETSNVVISNVTIQDSVKDGIIVKASGVTIENSTIKSNGRNGIELHANTLVYNNTITDNQKDGINVTANSNYARIISNIIEDNDDQAIYVYGSHHVEIKNNELEDNDYGILLHHANFTQMHNNDIKEHDHGGIKFVSTNYCNLTSSTIKDNNGRGIWFRSNSNSNNLRDTASSGSTNNDIELDSSKRNTGFNFTFGSGKIGVDQNSDFRVMNSLNIKFVNGSSAFASVDLELFNYDMVLYASPFYGGNDGVSGSNGFIEEELTVAYEIYNGSSTTEDVDTTLKYHYGVRGKSIEVDMSTSHTETVDVPSFWTKGLVRNVDTDTDYYKIQHAIDNASAGDTLNIWAWTYYETIEIDEELTIIGNGTGNTTINGTWSGIVAKITSSDVTLRNLKLITGSNATSTPVLSIDANEALIEGVIVENGKRGIDVRGGGNDARIFNTTVQNIDENALTIQSASSNAVVYKSIFSHSNHGIFIEFGHYPAKIIDCSIHNNTNEGIRSESYGSIIRDNIIVDNSGWGIWLDGDETDRPDTLVINNTILGNDDGIQLDRQDAILLDNTINDNDRYGINIIGSTNIYLWNNTMSNNDEYDIGVLTSSSCYAIGTTFSTIIVGSSSSLIIKSYIDLDVNDASGDNMSGIDIKVMEDNVQKYATSYFGGSDSKTDSSGTIATFLINSKKYDGSSTSEIIPTYVSARYHDWVETTSFDSSSTIQITVPDLRVQNTRTGVLTYHIQTSLDASVSDDTIHAWTGIYYENLVITEEITLEGNGTSTVINGTYTNNGIEVREDNVVIKNLTVVSSSTGGDEAGIAVYDSDDVQILDVKFVDNTYGLYLEDAQDLTIGDGIFDVKDYGIYATGSSSGLNVIDSEFRNGSSFNACIFQSSSEENGDAQIISNTFDNCYTGWKSGSSSNIFGDNTLRDNDYGIMLTGTESYNNMISDNTFDDSYYGIYIYNTAHDNNLFDNVFDDSEEYDIRLSDSDDTVSYNNTFSDISVSEDANMWIKVYIDLTVYDNSSNAFSNADVRVKEDNLVLYSTSYFGGSDAKTNSTGQIATFLVATLQYNGSSTPDAVTTTVTARSSDWIETNTYNVNNAISISVDDFRVQNEDTEEMYYSISGAIDEANLGDTLLIWAGTYRELVTIDKELTLVGNGTSSTIINGSFQGDVVTVTADEVSIEAITISGSGTDNSGLVVTEGVCTFTELKFTYNDIGYNSSGDFNVVSDSNFISNAIGVLIDGDDNVVLSNYFSENPKGIQVNNNSEDTRLDDNEITKSSNLGIYLYGAEETTVKNNYIHNNSGNSMYLESSHENIIYLNTLEYNSADVMVLAVQSGNSSIHNNTFKSNDDSPVKVDSSYHNTFRDNVFTSNDDYFTLEGGGYNHLISNTFDDTGIQLYNSNNQFLTGNTITDAPKKGIRIFKSSSDNYLADNVISDSDDEDLYVGGSGGQRNNRGYNNTFDDIKVLSNGEFIVLDYIWIRTLNSEGNMSGNDIRALYDSDVLYATSYFGGNNPVTDSDGLIPEFLAPIERYNGSSTPAKVITPITVRYVDWVSTFDLDPYQGSSITAFVPDLRVKNDNTGEWTYHIQTSIDNAGTDNLIIVTSGTYYENVVVNKARLTLEAQYEDVVIIDAQDSGCAITISKHSVTIRGFNITNSFEWDDPFNSSGIRVLSDSNVIENNRVTESYVGILLETADSNTIEGNYIDEVDIGILLTKSDSNTIDSNTIHSTDSADIEISNVGYSTGSKLNTIRDNNEIEKIYFKDSDSNKLMDQEVVTVELVDSVRNYAISSEYQYVICDADSSFYLKNFLDINVSRLDEPLADVDLKVWDGSMIVYSTPFFGGTDSMTTDQGKTPNSILVIYRVYNGSSVGSDNVTQMKVRVGDWFKSEQSLLDEYKTFDFDVPVFRVTNQNTAVEYNYIQRAIDNATAGDTIFLSSSEYNEPINITEEIILKGNGTSTIINGDGSTGIIVSEDSVTIKNLKIINANEEFSTGIDINDSEDTVITSVRFGTSTYGIVATNSWYLIVNNSNFEVSTGIYLSMSSGALIRENVFSNAVNGINFAMDDTTENSYSQIINNTFDNCYRGWLGQSSNNIFRDNTLKDTTYGIILSTTQAHNNMISNNTFDDLSDGREVYSGIRILTGAHNNSLFNNVFGDSQEFDIWLSGSDDTVSYNNTFSDIFVDTDANMWVKVYLDLIVYDNSSITFLDADVEVKQDNLVVYSSSYFGGSDPKTSSYGTIETFLINHKEYNGNSTPTIIPTFVTIRNYDWEKTFTSDPSSIIQITVPDFRVQNTRTGTLTYYIQTAIDNALSGDTIRAWSGTYYENIEITEAIILEGNGTSTLITVDVSDSGFGSPPIANSSSEGIKITTDGVEVSDLQISNFSLGIKISEADSVLLSNIRIIDVTSHGVDISQSQNVEIVDLHIESSGLSGVYVGDASSNFEMSYTVVIDVQNGIEISSENAYIHNVTVLNNDGYGCYVHPDGTGVTISGSTINDNGLNGIKLQAVTSATIDHNTIYDNGLTEVYVISSYYVDIYDNNISDSQYGVGIATPGSENIEIYRNEMALSIHLNSSFSKVSENNFVDVTGGSVSYDDTAIVISGSYNTISDNTIYNVGVGFVFLYGDHDYNLVENNTLDFTSDDMWYYTSGTNNRFINTDIGIVDIDEASYFDIRNYVDLEMYTINGPAVGVELNVSYDGGSSIYYTDWYDGSDSTTDSSGTIKRLFIIYQVFDGNFIPDTIETRITYYYDGAEYDIILDTSISHSERIWVNLRPVVSIDQINGVGDILETESEEAIKGADVVMADSHTIAYWPFNEGSGSTVTDATATAYTGTISPTAIWNDGRSNATDDYSVEFDGTFTNIGTNADFDATEFTAEVWFKTDTADKKMVLFSDKAGSKWAYNMYLNTGDLAFDFTVDNGNLVLLTSAMGIGDNMWHFAVVVRGEDYVELWLDGVKVAETDWSGDIDFTAGPISIGQNPQGSESFVGLIDDLRFSDIARHNEDFMTGSGIVELVSDSYDLDGEISEYIWTSAIDGEIGRGQILYLPVDSLTQGSHNIQLQVIDDNGTVSDYASSVLVVMERPDAEIVSVKVNGDSVWSGWASIEGNSGDNISFEGRTTSQQFISEFSWASDRDGVISTVAEFYIDTLSNGTHAITFKLKGANGLWSAEQEVGVDINGRPVIGNSNVTSETLDRLKSAMFKVRIEDDNTAGSSLVYPCPEVESLRCWDVGYRINGGAGEWESDYISDTSYDSGTGELEFTFTPDQNAPTGEYEFFVAVTDEEGGASGIQVISQSITVQNNDPEIQRSNLDSEDGEFLEFTEGTTIELGVNATDADGVISTVIWYADPDGDGSFEEIGIGANFMYENNNLPPGENTIKSRVLDNEGGYDELSYTIVIKEAPVEVTLIDTLVEDFSSNLPLIALLGGGMVMVVGTILLRRRKVTEVVAEGLEVDDGVSEQPRETFDTLEWDIPTDAQGNALIIGEYMAKRRESYLTYPNNDEVLDYLHNNRERFQISSYFDVPAEPPVVLTDWALPDNLRGNVHLDSPRKQIVDRITTSSPDKNFVIIGEPGVGKTVMMFEVFDRLMYQAPVGILTTDMIAKAHEMFGVRVFYDDIPENQKLVEALTDNEIQGVIVTSREADWKALPTEMQAKFDRLTVPLFNDLDMKEMIKKMMTFQSIGFNEKAIDLLAEYSEGSPIYVWSMVREMMHRSVKSLSEEYIKENSIKGMINYVAQLLQRLLKDGEEYRSGGLHALASLIFLSDHMEERYCNDYFFDAYVEVLSKHTEEKLDDKMNPKTLNLVLAYLPINDSVIRFPHDTWPDVLQGWGDMNPFSSELRMINRLFADSGLFQSLKKEVVSEVWNSTYERYKRTPSRQKISLLALTDTLFQNFTIDELKKLGVDIDVVRQVASTYSHIPQAAKLLSKIQAVLPQTVTRIINVQDIGSDKGHAPYKIQEMYLIYNDGRMITSLMDEEAKVDSDIMSSMLTAINDFVKDSFQTSGNLGSIDYGENQVILERGKHTILASVVYGEANRDLRSRMGRALTKMEDEFGTILKKWDGDVDSLSGSLKHLEPVMDLSKSVTKGMIDELQALKKVNLRSSWSQIAGFVQVNLMINNYSKKQLKGAKFSLEYGADYLKLIKTEPSLKHSVTEVELKPIKANDEVGVTLYFEPLKSTQASLNVHLDYEAKGGQSSGVSTAVFERVDLYKEGASLDVSSLDNASKAEIVTTTPVEVVESTVGEVEIVEAEVEEVTDAPIEEIEMAAEVVEVAEVEAEVVEVAEVEAEVVEVAEVEAEVVEVAEVEAEVVEVVETEVEDVETDEPIEEIVMASEVEEAEVIEAVPEAEVIEEPAEPAPDPGESGVDDILSKLSELDDPENAPKKKKKKSDEEEDKSGMDDVFGKLDEL